MMLVYYNRLKKKSDGIFVSIGYAYIKTSNNAHQNYNDIECLHLAQ